MKSMKTASFIILDFIVLYISPLKLKPNIAIINNTDKNIHVYVLERNVTDDEPSIEEVEQLKRVRVISPKSKIIITPSLNSLLINNIKLDIGL